MPSATVILLALAMLLPLQAQSEHNLSLSLPDSYIDIDSGFDDTEDFRHLGPAERGLAYRSQVEVELEDEHNANLNSDRDRDDRGYLMEYGLTGVYRRDERFQLTGRLEFSSQIERRNPGPHETESQLRLKELHMRWQLPNQGDYITVGRQEVVDKRRWLFDEDLDSISFLRVTKNHAWHAIAGREAILRDSFNGEHDNDKPNILFVRYYRSVNPQQQASAYLLHVDERGFGNNERSSYFGGRALGNYEGGLDYWAEAALMVGHSDSRRASGLGFDLGLTKTLRESPRRPSFTLALAYGSGDDGQGTDSAFRQSGLHSNKGRFGGVSTFRYYGHAFDPELSNLLILTTGIGIRPARNWSLDLIYHHYRQAKAADEMRDDGIRADPEGTNTRLGSELDLVFGLRNALGRDFSIQAVIGVFYPGAAYGAAARSTRHFELSFKWKF